MPDSERALPVEPMEVGVDVRVQRELQRLILDDTIELAPSGRTNVENYKQWTREDLIMYGKWLCALLEFDQSETTKPLLKGKHINRASKLGLGPSSIVFYSDEMSGMTDLQRELGAVPHFNFGHWTLEECARHGKKLPRNKRGVPGHREIRAAQKKGKFPGVDFIYERFGSLQGFHEYMGFFDSFGFQVDDCLDWGAAVKRQNGIDFAITSTVTGLLSAKGRAPSHKLIYKYYDHLPDFDTDARDLLVEQLRIEAEQQAAQYREIERLKRFDKVFVNTIAGLEGERLLRVAAQYRTVRKLLPREINGKVTKNLAQRASADSMARGLILRFPHLDMLEIETVATELGLMDALWPTYRFENVDLRLPDDA